MKYDTHSTNTTVTRCGRKAGSLIAVVLLCGAQVAEVAATTTTTITNTIPATTYRQPDSATWEKVERKKCTGSTETSLSYKKNTGCNGWSGQTLQQCHAHCAQNDVASGCTAVHGDRVCTAFEHYEHTGWCHVFSACDSLWNDDKAIAYKMKLTCTGCAEGYVCGQIQGTCMLPPDPRTVLGTDVTEINLSNKKMSGPLPDLAALYPSLEVLIIRDNPDLNAESIWPWLSKFTKLRHLQIASVNIKDGNLPDLSHLKDTLEVLSISWLFKKVDSVNAKASDAAPIPNWLSTFTKLKTVNFCDSNRNGKIPDLSASASTLTSVNVCGVFNMEQDVIPRWLSKCTKLTGFNFHGSQRIGTIPDVRHLAATLEYIHIANNPLMDPAPIPAYLSGFTKLQGLGFQITNRIGNIPDLSKATTTLRWIDISNNPNLDPGPMPAWTAALSSLNPDAKWSNFANTNRYGVKDPNQYLKSVAQHTIDLVAAPDLLGECEVGREVSAEECKAYAEGSTAEDGLVWQDPALAWTDRPSGCWRQNKRIFFNTRDASSTCRPDIDTRGPDGPAPNDEAECKQCCSKLCKPGAECTAGYEGAMCQTCKGCKVGLRCGPANQPGTCQIPADLISAFGSTPPADKTFRWNDANLVGEIPNVCAVYPDITEFYTFGNPLLEQPMPLPSWLVDDCTSLVVFDFGTLATESKLGGMTSSTQQEPHSKENTVDETSNNRSQTNPTNLTDEDSRTSPDQLGSKSADNSGHIIGIIFAVVLVLVGVCVLFCWKCKQAKEAAMTKELKGAKTTAYNNPQFDADPNSRCRQCESPVYYSSVAATLIKSTSTVHKPAFDGIKLAEGGSTGNLAMEVDNNPANEPVGSGEYIDVADGNTGVNPDQINQPWFVRGMDKGECKARVAAAKKQGSFLVRVSRKTAGAYAFCINLGDGQVQEELAKPGRGGRLALYFNQKRATPPQPDLVSLVEYCQTHSLNPSVGITLKLGVAAPAVMAEYAQRAATASDAVYATLYGQVDSGLLQFYNRVAVENHEKDEPRPDNDPLAALASTPTVSLEKAIKA
eukprot:gene15121-8000_t